MAYLSELLGREVRDAKGTLIGSLSDVLIMPEGNGQAFPRIVALAVKRNPEIKEFNPLALWDLHYVKEIDDSGYIRKLYQ